MVGQRQSATIETYHAPMGLTARAIGFTDSFSLQNEAIEKLLATTRAKTISPVAAAFGAYVF